MFCPYCGAEIILEGVVNKIKYGFCEECDHEFTIKDYGQIDADQMTRKEKGFETECKTGVAGFEPFFRTLIRLEREK
mgnify:CR=1 FL=1